MAHGLFEIGVAGPPTRIPPGEQDPDAGCRCQVSRVVCWHPPMVRWSYDDLRAPGRAFTRRMGHPRAEIIGANPAVRLMYTCQIGTLLDPNRGCHRATGVACQQGAGAVASRPQKTAPALSAARRCAPSAPNFWISAWTVLRGAEFRRSWTSALTTAASQYVRTKSLVPPSPQCWLASQSLWGTCPALGGTWSG